MWFIPFLCRLSIYFRRIDISGSVVDWLRSQREDTPSAHTYTYSPFSHLPNKHVFKGGNQRDFRNVTKDPKPLFTVPPGHQRIFIRFYFHGAAPCFGQTRRAAVN